MRFFKIGLCFVLVISVIVCSCIPASASDPASDILIACLDIARDWVWDTSDEIKNMTPDQFYNWYTYTKGNPQSSTWKALYRAIDGFNKKANGISVSPYLGVTVPSESEIGLEESHYKRIMVDRDILESLENNTVSALTYEWRLTSLDELDIVFDGSVATDNIDPHYFDRIVTNHGKKYTSLTPFSCYYDVSRAKRDSNSISFYVGGYLPPAIYIPVGCTSSVYQHGSLLSDAGLYIILGRNSLLRCYFSGNMQYVGFYYYNPGSSIDDIVFGVSQARYNSNQYSSSFGKYVPDYSTEIVYTYSNGVQFAKVGESLFPGWEMVDLLEGLRGLEIEYESVSPVPSNLPGNIPYDNNGNVVVLVPEGGGDVVYMNPTDYNNYVTNNQLVEGDTVSNEYSNSTVNDITNNYYNSFIETSDNASGGSYDDTTLLGKLDELIDWVKKIYGYISGSVTVEPCYDDFSDCFFDNVPFKQQIENELDDLADGVDQGVSSYSPTDIITDQELSAYSVNDPILPSMFDLPESNVIGLNPTYLKLLYHRGFSGVTSLDVFPSYRQPIREVFTFLAYGLAIICYWRSLNSIFHITGSALGDD